MKDILNTLMSFFLRDVQLITGSDITHNNHE